MLGESTYTHNCRVYQNHVQISSQSTAKLICELNVHVYIASVLGTDKTVEQNNAPMPPTSEPLKDLETSPQLEKKEMEEEALTKAGHLPDEEEKEINTRNDSANILMASGGTIFHINYENVSQKCLTIIMFVVDS